MLSPREINGEIDLMAYAVTRVMNLRSHNATFSQHCNIADSHGDINEYIYVWTVLQPRDVKMEIYERLTWLI